jgi:hypothetical protein
MATFGQTAGRGLSHGFLDQDFNEVRRVIDTNITGTLYLIQKVGREMRSRGEGRILILGSIAGYMPGPFTAVYNASKASGHKLPAKAAQKVRRWPAFGDDRKTRASDPALPKGRRAGAGGRGKRLHARYEGKTCCPSPFRAAWIADHQWKR